MGTCISITSEALVAIELMFDLFNNDSYSDVWQSI